MQYEIGDRTESEIVGILTQKIRGSDSYNQSELARQRQDNMNMYYLNPLGNENEGRSQIQSSDVFDAVEGTKAVMHEALTSGRDLLHFDPLNENDVDLAKMANRYVKDRFKENDGYRFLIDSLHDGVLAKNAVCKYYWVEDTEERKENFMGLPLEKFQGMLNQPDIQLAEPPQITPSIGPDGMQYPVYSGSIIITTDKSHVGFRLIKPEDFFGDETAESDTDFSFASDREILRKGELLEDYAHLHKEIKNAPKYVHSRRDQDDLIRRSNDDSWRTEEQNEKAWERDTVEIHHCYIELWGDEGYGIYQYKMLGERTLLWEWPSGDNGEDLEDLPEDFDEAKGLLVDEIPYLVWSPYPLSHRWDGLAQADVVRDLQLTATNLKRSMVDHTLMTNNPMREVNLEFVRNPRDLIDNVIGAVVDTMTAPNSGQIIKPIAQPPMSNSAFQTLEMVRQETEQRSSYTRLSAGLNQDAVSKQNSADLIGQMTGSGNRRIMMMTRNFVELFLMKLYKKIYSLGVANDSRMYEVELNGNWVQMSPGDWPDRPDMEVITAMTPEASMQSAMNKIAIHQMLIADPESNFMYRDKKRFNMYQEILRELGETATDRFLENPDSDEYKAAQKNQMDQEVKKQQQMAEAQARQERILDKQLELQELQITSGADQGQQRIDNDAYEAADKQSLEEDKFEEVKEVNDAEILLETIKIEEGKNISGVSIGG